jgi:hypothetical protein
MFGLTKVEDKFDRLHGYSVGKVDFSSPFRNSRFGLADFISFRVVQIVSGQT